MASGRSVTAKIRRSSILSSVAAPTPPGMTTLGNGPMAVMISCSLCAHVLLLTVAVKNSGRMVSENRSLSQAANGNLGLGLPPGGGGGDRSSATSGRAARIAYIPSLPPPPAHPPPCQPPPCQPPPCQPPPKPPNQPPPI